MKRYALVGLVLLAALAMAEYMPEIGCWTYPDKVICLKPSEVNATVFIENVSCYSYDLYGTGSWTILPCIANANLEPTTVEVCYKMMPVKNGVPDIENYNPNYNCHREVWEGPVQLQILRGRIPWECKEIQVDNYTKACEITVNKKYYISGIGNDVNGTKAIVVTELREEANMWIYILVVVIILVVGYYWIQKKKK